MTDPRRNLPGVDVLLASQAFSSLLVDHPRARVVDVLRRALVDVRSGLAGEGETAVPQGEEWWASRVEELLLEKAKPSLRGVINATGVVLHTNLGRAPLSRSAREAMALAGPGYSNL